MKILNVGLTGDEIESYIFQQEYIVIVEIDGDVYKLRIKKGKRADGNSVPFIIAPLLKPNGPHVDSACCHDSVYEEPYVYTIFGDHKMRLTKAQCDQIYYNLLAGDTGLLDFEFKCKPSLIRKLGYWFRFKRAPEFIMKKRVCPNWIISIAKCFLSTVGWFAWIGWRMKERRNK